MRRLFVGCLGSLIMVGCTSSGPIGAQDTSTVYDYGCAPATLGCPCDQNGQCYRGMTCQSNVCVEAPDTGADVMTDSDAMTDATPDSDSTALVDADVLATDSAANDVGDSVTTSEAAIDSATDTAPDSVADTGSVVDSAIDVAADTAGADASQDSSTCPTGPVLINEIQTAGATASDEFVELYNPNNCAIDLTGYSLMYESATGTTPSTLIALASTISAHGFLVYAGSGFTGTATGTWGGGLASTGGAVALEKGTTIVHSVGWGNATNSFVEVAAAAAPAASQSIGLLPDGTCGFNNATDFGVRTTPTPGAPNQ